MTAVAPAPVTDEVLTHHDAMLDVYVSITQDCALTGVRPLAVTVANYSPGFFHVSVHLDDAEQVDAIAAVWSCRPDDGVNTFYQRHAVLEVDGRTVTVDAFSSRPRLALPIGYRPAQVAA